MDIVLVHGAWHGGWCWRWLVPELEALGARPHCPDLPGHGDDADEVADASLAAWVERIVWLVCELDRPVTLVGHSLGGMVISAVAEQIPERLTELVFLCAMLPRDGESAAELGAEDGESGLNAAIERGSDGLLRVPPERARGLFYHDVPDDRVDHALSELQPQATAPLTTPFRRSATGGPRVPRRYVICTDDRAITPAQQRRMLARVPCEERVELPCGHSPFLSDPARLARVLLRSDADA